MCGAPFGLFGEKVPGPFFPGHRHQFDHVVVVIREQVVDPPEAYQVRVLGEFPLELGHHAGRVDASPRERVRKNPDERDAHKGGNAQQAGHPLQRGGGRAGPKHGHGQNDGRDRVDRGKPARLDDQRRPGAKHRGDRYDDGRHAHHYRHDSEEPAPQRSPRRAWPGLPDAIEDQADQQREARIQRQEIAAPRGRHEPKGRKRHDKCRDEKQDMTPDRNDRAAEVPVDVRDQQEGPG